MFHCIAHSILNTHLNIDKNKKKFKKLCGFVCVLPGELQITFINFSSTCANSVKRNFALQLMRLKFKFMAYLATLVSNFKLVDKNTQLHLNRIVTQYFLTQMNYYFCAILYKVELVK